MSKKTYVTTAIPYVNGKPHIGFALELVQADAIARYHRMIGNDTRLQTGTDENAFKNVQTARELGVSTEELVERNASLFHGLAKRLNISFDSFIRTTDERHRKAVEFLWKRLRSKDVYKKVYTGLYCNGCEDFFSERDLVSGCCPDHGGVPVKVCETNYFFRLSAYQDSLEKLLSSETVRVVPATRKNEVLSFVRNGLQDFSVSRVAERSGGWGIAVPGDPSQVIYVWIDALMNYISGLGYGVSARWKEFWNEKSWKIHVIGKNVWKFHAVYWPALLLSSGLPLPNEIVVHGFLTENGQKISKFRGDTVDLLELIREYGPDGIRYYLLRAVSPFNDGDFSISHLKSVYNAELCNGLGNLLSRVTSLWAKGRFGRYEGASKPEAPVGYHEALGNYEFDKAIKILWQVVTRLNQDIDRAKPWEALKLNKSEVLKSQLRSWLDAIRQVAYWSEPFIPEASKRICAVLSQGIVTGCGAVFPRLK